jgi:Bcr/CflA subfamily drug resistance transporter
MKNRSTAYIITILAPLVVSFAFALDLYIPTVPHLVHVFQTTDARIQLTLSLFVLMQGLGQLVFGPWSDSVGRRPIALGGAVLFIVASLLCAAATTIWILILGRLIQAAGACAMMVVAFAMVRDCFDEAKSAKVYSYLNSTIAVSPLFAPVIGGYMSHAFGWRANFYLLVGIGVLCLIAGLFFVKETHDHSKRLPLGRDVFVRYGSLMWDRRFWPFALCAGAGIAAFFCFFSISPFIIITLLHVPVMHFGYYFAVLGVVFLLGSMLSGKLAPIVGAKRLLRLGAFLILIGGITLFLAYWMFGLGLLEFLPPVFVGCLGGAFVVGNAAALALAPFPQFAGAASALLGAVEFVMASICGTLMMHEAVTSTQPYAVVLLVVGALSVFCSFYGVESARKTT